MNEHPPDDLPTEELPAAERPPGAVTRPGPYGEEYGEEPSAERERQASLRDRLAAGSLTTRRDCLRAMATVSGGLAVGSVAVSAGILHRHGDAPASETAALKVADRLLPRQAVTFNYPGEHDRAMAVRLADGSVVGYSTVCTHLACGAIWRADRGSEGELFCPCHEGAFDVRTGAVTAGPPPRGLPKVLLVEHADGSVWAVGTAYSGEDVRHAVCRALKAEKSPTADQVCADRSGG